MKRRDPFVNNRVYHLYNRSIGKYQIFKHESDCRRMLELMSYYQYRGQRSPFSDFSRLRRDSPDLTEAIACEAARERWLRAVSILAWCLIPNHYHFVLQQNSPGGIELCMRRTLDGFTRYINLRRNRRGPLWETRMRSKLIVDEAQLRATIDYIHRNPVKHRCASQAELWPYSSIHSQTKILETLAVP